MLRYLLRRTALAVVVTLMVLIVLIAIVRLLPGEPATLMLGPRATPELIAQVREQMSLDEPILRQVSDFVLGALQGDLGEDFFSRRPVLDIVLRAVPHTMALAVSSMLLATVVAIPLAVLAATRPGSLLDRFLAITSIVAISIPSLIAGLLLLIIFSVQIGVFPIIGTGSFADPLDYLYHLVLPTVALALNWIGYLARLLRASLVEELDAQYVRAAKAYGVRNRVIFLYALKNAFIPTLAVVGYGIASLMGGALFVEIIFSRVGIGTVLADAISTRNYIVVQGTVVIVALLFVLINLAVDIMYRFLDPRVRVEESSAT